MAKKLFLEIEMSNLKAEEMLKVIEKREIPLRFLEVITGSMDWKRVPVRCFADGDGGLCLGVMIFLDNPEKIDPQTKACVSAGITESFCSILDREPERVNINIGAPINLLRGSHHCTL